ncbi:hypothetical protein [Candidatus Ichthyocystis sparus]|uniref:hypothetical protein n=1 Tax=Candidatus Ichthyocystis sparus TaxID=1561004 RepID=UPI000B804CE6|nr:hypothetical protein [Candidatus Ichthyocystis sparus]
MVKENGCVIVELETTNGIEEEQESSTEDEKTSSLRGITTDEDRPAVNICASSDEISETETKRGDVAVNPDRSQAHLINRADGNVNLNIIAADDFNEQAIRNQVSRYIRRCHVNCFYFSISFFPIAIVCTYYICSFAKNIMSCEKKIALSIILALLLLSLAVHLFFICLKEIILRKKLKPNQNTRK